MAKVSIYISFNRQAEEAFEFYKKVFKTDYIGEITRFCDVPRTEDKAPLPDEDRNLVKHVELAVMGDFILMGCDSAESEGVTGNRKNNVHLNLETNTKAEADSLFRELSAGGTIIQPIADTFWGAYYGSLTDKFGINWMINYTPKP